MALQQNRELTLRGSESLHQSLETRMIAESFPIGVVRNPIAAGEPGFDCPLQASKGLVFLAKDREDTAGVVENRVVIRRQRHRPLIPLLGTLDFSKSCKNYGT